MSKNSFVSVRKPMASLNRPRTSYPTAFPVTVRKIGDPRP